LNWGAQNWTQHCRWGLGHHLTKLQPIAALPVRDGVLALRAEPSSQGCKPTAPEHAGTWPRAQPRPDLHLPRGSPAHAQPSAPSEPLARRRPAALACCSHREGLAAQMRTRGLGSRQAPSARPREAELHSQEGAGLTEIWGL